MFCRERRFITILNTCYANNVYFDQGNSKVQQSISRMYHRRRVQKSILSK
jgi:hypothetical protein